jgi:hypothetical protein
MDYKLVINKAQQLLRDNPGWQERYAAYAESILQNAEFIGKMRERFNEWPPLYVYLRTGDATDASKKVAFNLRYLGQMVADLHCDKEELTLSTAGHDDKNERDFGCGIRLKDCAWASSQEATDFRKHFMGNPKRNDATKKNEEHRIESLLISEFSKPGGDKHLRGIQPVKIADAARFPMPTALGACGEEAKFLAGRAQGHIDILARVGRGGPSTNLCIIEVKDEYTPDEPASAAIKQALTYAVFIRELLCSDEAGGASWRKVFGFASPVPNKLTLYAACAMPDIKDADTSFAGVELPIGEDTIQLHYIYFDEKDNKITKIRTSLPTIP